MEHEFRFKDYVWGVRYIFIDEGLIGCNVLTTVPGRYNLSFSVKNSRNLTSAVYRTVVVQSVCLAGEHLCNDEVSHYLLTICTVRNVFDVQHLTPD